MHITRLMVIAQFSSLGLVDVNKIIAWYYNELMLEDPVHTLFGVEAEFGGEWLDPPPRTNNRILRLVEGRLRRSRPVSMRVGLYELVTPSWCGVSDSDLRIGIREHALVGIGCRTYAIRIVVWPEYEYE
jgi:hypothetical protein